MPLELAREMAKHYRTVADWMVQQATALEAGETRFYQGDTDASRDLAADLRHRANNIEALIVGFERIAAREQLKANAPLSTAVPNVRLKTH